MRVRMLVGLVVFLAIAAPAQARAGGFSGTVVAKQPQRGMLVLSAPGGAGLSVHARAARARVGDRVAVQGSRLADGTVRASRLRVLSHTRRALIRGVVVRRLSSSTLVATGRSVIKIRHEASDDRDLRAGQVAEFRVRIDDDNELEEMAVAPLGLTANVRIEGRVVTVSPFVVSVEGLPITITVPAGMTLPAALTPGDRIELIVQAAAGNLFTLVAIDEIENNDQGVAPEQGQEVEVEGSVVTSTVGQLVVQQGSDMFTFIAPAGDTLPVLPTGTRVEVRGVMVNGVLTLTRLKLEDNNDDSGAGSSGSGGGGDDGGGHDGGGDGGGGH